MMTVNNFLKRSLTCALSVTIGFVSIPVRAQTDTIVGRKVITNTRLVGIGATQILDTYLSPEKYKGTELRYISHTVREREGRRWSREIVHQGSIARADNRSGNGNEIAGRYQFGYGWHQNWYGLDGRLHLKAGGMIDVDLGFIYNTRNGNNPSQAIAALNLTPSAAISYQFTVKRRAINR